MSVEVSNVERFQLADLPNVVHPQAPCMKVLSCLPLIGVIFSLTQQLRINQFIAGHYDACLATPNTGGRQIVIAFLKSKVEFKVAGMISMMLTTALIIVGLMTGFFAAGLLGPLGSSILSAALAVGGSIWIGMQIREINQKIEFIEQFGLPDLLYIP